MLFTIHLFSRLQILYNQADCTEKIAKAARQQAFLAYLFTSPTLSRPVSELLEIFYSDERYQDPRFALKIAVRKLRELFQIAAEDAPDDIIDLSATACSLNPGCFHSPDVARLSELCQQARQLDRLQSIEPDDILRLFEQTEELYAGRLLQTLESFRHYEGSDYYHSQYLSILKNVLSALQARGQADKALSVLKSAYAKFPADDEIQRLLLNALFSSESPSDVKLYYKLMLKKRPIDGDCTEAIRAFYLQYSRKTLSGEGDYAIRGARRCLPIVCEPSMLEGYGVMMQGIAVRNGLSLFTGMLRFERSALADQALSELRLKLRSSDVLARLNDTEYALLMLVRRYPHGFLAMERVTAALNALTQSRIEYAETTIEQCMRKAVVI